MKYNAFQKNVMTNFFSETYPLFVISMFGIDVVCKWRHFYRQELADFELSLDRARLNVCILCFNQIIHYENISSFVLFLIGYIYIYIQ